MSTNPKIEVEQEDDGRWIAEIPALPGVMAYGATRDEAVACVKSLALRVLTDGLDAEQLELGSSDDFWKLITERRQQPVIGRDELNERLNANNGK